MVVDNSLIIALKIKRTTVRKKIFLSVDKAITPTKLTEKIYGNKTNNNQSIVSRALKELSKLGVVKVINPEEKWGRYYELTPLGKKVKAYLIKNPD